MQMDPFLEELTVRDMIKQYYFSTESYMNANVAIQKSKIKTLTEAGNKKAALLEQIKLGDLYYRSGMYALAYKEYFESLEQLEAMRDSVMMGLVNLKIAGVHYLAHYAQFDEYNDRGLQLLQKTNDPALKAYYYYNKGKICLTDAEQQQYFQKAYDIQKKLIAEMPQDTVGQERLALYLNALRRIEEAIVIAEQFHSTFYAIYFLNNLGAIKLAENKPKEALRYFNRSYQLCRKERLGVLLRNTFGNMCYAYKAMGNFTLALNFLKLELLAEECAYEERYELQYTEYKVKFNTDEKEKGIHSLQQKTEELTGQVQLESYQKYTLLFGVLVLLVVALHMYISRKKLSTANKLIEAEKNTVLQQKQKLDALHAELLQNEKKLTQAQHIAKLANWEWDQINGLFHFSEQFPLLFGVTDAALKSDFRKAILKTIYPEDIRIPLLLLKSKSPEIVTEEIIFRVLVASEIRWLLAKFTATHEDRAGHKKLFGTVQDITVQKSDEEIKIKMAQQQSFTRQLFQSQEEERKRIAHELHDGLGQDILLLRNTAQLGLNNSEINDAGKEQLHAVNNLAGTLLQTVREISFALIPVHLERVGLTEIIKDTVRKTSNVTGIDITSSVAMIDKELPAHNEINLFRIVQECLNNIVKHSSAKHAHIEIRKEKSYIEIEVADDGIGFVMHNGQINRTGIGQSRLQNRVTVMNGTLQIFSAPERGCTVNVQIPIGKHANEN